MASSKKGISAHQLHRTLKVTYKTAWFMAHRIREAMRSGSFDRMGGPGEIVELDETTQGRRDGSPTRKELRSRVYGGWTHRNIVFTLVQRNGQARSFHVDS